MPTRFHFCVFHLSPSHRNKSGAKCFLIFGGHILRQEFYNPPPCWKFQIKLTSKFDNLYRIKVIKRWLLDHLGIQKLFQPDHVEMVGQGREERSRVPETSPIPVDLSVRASFPSSPGAIVLSPSFLHRWQVKRPIRAGQRGRAPFAEDT